MCYFYLLNRSIVLDYKFISEIASYYSIYPIVGNLRNGLWYYPRFDDTCYFKSTDGHSYQWSFSFNRLNLSLLNLLHESDGVVIVDSTRFGKPFPDSLSKTIPIWCSVWNLYFFSESYLCLPPFIPPSEVDQIEKLLNKWKEELKCHLNSLNDIPKIKKPLKCYWINQSKYNYDKVHLNTCDYHSIICVNASKGDDYNNRIFYSWDYIAGAGDDEERWNKGLKPEIMYKHVEEIENATDKFELEKEVNNWIKEYENANHNEVDNIKISISPLHFYLSKNIPTITDDKSIFIININEEEEKEEKEEELIKSKCYIHYKLNSNKKYRVKWRFKFIPDIIKIINENIINPNKTNVYIVCNEIGKLGVGLLLIFLCKCYDDSYNFTNRSIILTKQSINNRFCFLQQYINTVEVPRWLRQSIIAYFTNVEDE